ncbi:MAG TPA: GNAT family N-acetyltransferase [Egibacteraceae bacterium]|nr:GNAT family N-acetyltransferase [Egibacteraceae bacterium]
MTTTSVNPGVARAAGAELDAATAALARAFQDDPVACWVTPDLRRRRETLRGFFRLVTAAFLPHEHVYVVSDGSGAALWSPPGATLIEPADEAAFAQRMTDAVGAEDAARIFEVMALTDAHHPQKPCFYLGFMGVVPERQNRGLGGALLRPVLARGDADGVPAYLEASSPDSRRLYERHGFECIGELLVPGGPTLWAMWREPELR